MADRSHQLPVMESFLTLQGEGYWTGHTAWFIRLAGCDVGCVWCDVKESWEVAEDQWKPIADITNEAKNSGAKIVVITGGEPAMYDMTELTSELQSAGLKTHIETSGAYEVRGTFDWICLSPKKFKPALPEVYEIANELKFIVFNDHDLKWAQEQVNANKTAASHLYLQPEWGKKDEMSPKIVEYIKQHPNWAMSLQTHKYLDIP